MSKIVDRKDEGRKTERTRKRKDERELRAAGGTKITALGRLL
jgi:hypothetical protein